MGDVSYVPLSPGSTLDGFEIVRFLAKGGMGDVYLARDLKLGRRVALKLIGSRASASRGALARFLFEARATAMFSHPNIVTVYAAGEVEGRPYLALEYVEGQTLRQRLAEGRLRLGEAMRAALAVAEALAEAHRHDVLHLDLKPENVIIARDGRPRVLDFGLARWAGLLHDEAPAAGTPAYMAPEQWRRDPQSPATDVWALGVMLHELVFHRRPFSDGPEGREAVLSETPALRQRRSDAPTPLLDLIFRALAKPTSERPSSAEAVGVLAELLAPRSAAQPDQSPFRGLLAFDETQAPFFFGREAELSHVSERLRGQAMLPVVGASGAGKSSFVRAGLLPRLREQSDWRFIAVRAGRRPFLQLAEALAVGDTRFSTQVLATVDDAGDADGEERPSAPSLAAELLANPARLGQLLRHRARARDVRLLLFIDQLEEVVTLGCPEEERRSFLRALCGAADDAGEPVRVVFTARDDFLSRLAEVPELGDALSELFVLRSPGEDALHDIIVRPLREVGYAFDDPALAGEILAAVRHEAMPLPMLQFTLGLLWERRDRLKRQLTRRTYEAIGGVAGALATHADETLAGLSLDQQATARALLLRLVTPERTRRVQPRAALIAGLSADTALVLERFISARLLSVRRSQGSEEAEPELELAHEALIGSWHRLARWLDESREELRLAADVEQAASLWEKRGARDHETWRDDGLAEASRLARRDDAGLSGRARAFVAAGERRARKQRLQRRWLSLGGVGVLAGIAVAALFIAAAFSREKSAAERRRAEAEREAARSALYQGQNLEARANLRSTLETGDDLVARALWRRLSLDPEVWRLPLPCQPGGSDLARDGATAAVACGGLLYLIDTATGRTRVDASVSPFVVAFSNDGRQLATVGLEGEVSVLDMASGSWRRFGSLHVVSRRVVFSPDDRLLATGSVAGELVVWDVVKGDRRYSLRPGIDSLSLSFSPDGALLAGGGASGTIVLWQADSGGELARVENPSSITPVAFSPDGRTLAFGGREGIIRLWDVASRTTRATLERHNGPPLNLAFSPDGARLLSVGIDRDVIVWDVAGARVERRLAHGEGGLAVSVAQDSRHVLTASLDGNVHLWDLGKPPLPVSPRGGRPSAVVFSPDGRRLVSAGDDRVVRVWDVGSGAIVHELTGHEGRIMDARISGDGSVAVTIGDDGARVWDLGPGLQLRALRPAQRSMLVGGAISHDGSAVAVADPGSGLSLLDAREGGRRWHVDASLSLLAFALEDRVLLGSKWGARTIHVWSAATGEPAGELTIGGKLKDMALTPDGGSLVTADDAGAVLRWDLAAQRAQALPFSLEAPRKIAVAADGSLASAGADEVVVLGPDGARRAIIPAGEETTALALSEDGRYLATGGRVGVNLWDAVSGERLWRGVALTASGAALTHAGWRGGPPGAPWAAELTRDARFTAISDDESTACWQAADGTLTLADAAKKERFPALPAAADLRVFPGGCLVLAAGDATLLRFGAAPTRLATGVRAISSGAAELLVAVPGEARILSLDGRLRTTVAIPADVVAISRVGARLAVAGRALVELIGVAGPSLASPPAEAITRLIEGPAGTLIAGDEQGGIHVWDTKSGALLERTALPGRVRLLARSGSKVFALGENGAWIGLDLEVLVMDRCALLDEIWRTTPLALEGARLQVRAPPRDHRVPAPGRAHRPSPTRPGRAGPGPTGSG